MSEEYKPFYKWYLSDLEKVKKNGLKVFSCFACGGGSTMGYKLAGFDVIGANDIDPEMAWHYKTNHNPKNYYLEDIRKFRQRNDLPKELFELDILDGSPPCSSFSMAGKREKDWGKKKQFREGQTEQVLDDLFFDFIELARKLQPKVVIAENVKGMLNGVAKGYVKQIINLFNVAGYDVQLFLLNAATMGVPQKRERVFFVCRRKDLNLSYLKLTLNMKPINVIDAFNGIDTNGKDVTTSSMAQYWKKCKPGESFAKYHPKGSLFGQIKLNRLGPSPTLTSKEYQIWHYDSCRLLSDQEYCVLGSYPLDYKFNKTKKDIAKYMIGMSVPPLMTYGLAKQVYFQIFKGK
jgi:DNA (cytosine-5)-methyltransferase 1